MPSLEQGPCSTIHLFGRHRLHVAIVEFLESTFRFIKPELINLLGRKRIEALKQLVRKLRPASRGEAHGFSFDGFRVHGSIVPRGLTAGLDIRSHPRRPVWRVKVWLTELLAALTRFVLVDL